MSDYSLSKGSRLSPTDIRPARSLLERRMALCSRITRGILLLFGVGAVVAQVAKIFPTFVDSGWDINLSNVTALAIGLVLLALGQSKAINTGIRAALGKHRLRTQRILFSLPFCLSLLVIILKLFLGATKPYKLLMGEGSFVEYGTVLAYFVACGFALPIATGFRKQSQWLLSGLYGLFSAFCLFVGFEEISWGQMVIGWQSNDFFSETNVQQETNLHNMPWFQDLLGEAFILVSFICVAVTIAGILRHRRQPGEPSPMLSPGISLDSTPTPSSDRTAATEIALGQPLKPQLSHFYFPGWYTLSYWAMTLVIYVIIEYLRPWIGFIITTDQEFAELLLSLGFMLVAITEYFRQGLLYSRRS